MFTVTANKFLRRRRPKPRGVKVRDAESRTPQRGEKRERGARKILTDAGSKCATATRGRSHPPESMVVITRSASANRSTVNPDLPETPTTQAYHPDPRDEGNGELLRRPPGTTRTSSPIRIAADLVARTTPRAGSRPSGCVHRPIRKAIRCGSERAFPGHRVIEALVRAATRGVRFHLLTKPPHREGSEKLSKVLGLLHPAESAPMFTHEPLSAAKMKLADASAHRRSINLGPGQLRRPARTCRFETNLRHVQRLAKRRTPTGSCPPAIDLGD